MFDVARRSSFERIASYWMDQIFTKVHLTQYLRSYRYFTSLSLPNMGSNRARQAAPGVSVLIIGAKSDVSESKRQVQLMGHVSHGRMDCA